MTNTPTNTPTNTLARRSAAALLVAGALLLGAPVAVAAPPEAPLGAPITDVVVEPPCWKIDACVAEPPVDENPPTAEPPAEPPAEPSTESPAEPSAESPREAEPAGPAEQGAEAPVVPAADEPNTRSRPAPARLPDQAAAEPTPTGLSRFALPAAALLVLVALAAVGALRWIRRTERFHP